MAKKQVATKRKPPAKAKPTKRKQAAKKKAEPIVSAVHVAPCSPDPAPAVPPVRGYKAFDSAWKCRDMQYEFGKTYEHKGDVKLCNAGLHFCEQPLDVLSYYPLPDAKLAEVAAEGVSDEKQNDSKRVARKLHLKAGLSIAGLIQAQVEFVSERAKGAEIASGYYSTAASSVPRSSPNAAAFTFSPSTPRTARSPSGRRNASTSRFSAGRTSTRKGAGILPADEARGRRRESRRDTRRDGPNSGVKRALAPNAIGVAKPAVCLRGRVV